MPVSLRRWLSMPHIRRRRTELSLVLPPALWCSGAPLAAAVAGVFAYQVLSLWLPLPVALAFLPTLRAMGDHQVTPVVPIRERKAA